MEIQNIFYALGTLFIVIAIVYFAWEYLLVLSKEAKTVILFCLVVVFFAVGRYLQERDI
jgi:hypothetical protein